MNGQRERANLLSLCRSAMPDVAGIVLATLSGSVVAHERSLVRNPRLLARQAAQNRHPDVQTSTLVPHEGALYLVVFVPPSSAGPQG
jgi:hypothetical protein